MTESERRALIERYAGGPLRLKEAIAAIPEEARKWRPAPGKWTAHEIVCHCADSETVAAMRIRFVLLEPDPLVVAYDQDQWTRELRYEDTPLDPALSVVESVRTHTANMLRLLPPEAWNRTARHSESGSYGAETWLSIYAEHVHKHAAQIDRNLAAWRERRA
jgi:DinB family protein